MTKNWTNLALGAMFLASAVGAQTAETDRVAPACLAADERSFGERLVDAGFPPAIEAAIAAGTLVVESEASTTEDTLVFEGSSPETLENVTAAANPSAVFGIPGEFLVGSWNNMNWRTNFHFGGARVFKKIVFDADFYVGQWAGRVNDDPTNYGSDYYCVLWLNSGQSWDNMYGYFNFLYPGGPRGEMQSNVGGYWNPQYGEYGMKITDGCGGVQSGNWYHMHWEYDAANGIQWWQVTNASGGTVCDAAGDTGVRSIQTSSMFLEMGSQYAPDGPEGATIGWRFSNLRVQFIGDTPVGRRPRRR